VNILEEGGPININVHTCGHETITTGIPGHYVVIETGGLEMEWSANTCTLGDLECSKDLHLPYFFSSHQPIGENGQRCDVQNIQPF